MNRKLTSLLLLPAVLLAVTLSACAAQEPSMVEAMSLAVQTAPFSDVSPDAPYAEAVAWCRAKGLMNGTSSTTFDPERTLSRGMVAAVLYRWEGSPAVSSTDPFRDNTVGAYRDAVIWAAGRGIVTGYGDGTFRPNDPVNRQQLAVILWRHAGEPYTATGSYSDRAALSAAFVRAVDWAVSTGAVTLRPNGQFAPTENAPRSEVATALYAYLANLNEEVQNAVSNQLQVTFNGHTYTATLADNSSARAFADYLRQSGGSVTVDAHDYGGFEKVGPLGTELPSNNAQIDTVPGDLILYQGNSVCLYYSTNSWSFTRLGRLDGDLSRLKADLGDGDVRITYSVN